MPHVLDMTRGKPLTLLLRFAVPLTAGYACQLLYTFADSVVIAQWLGAEAFAAVASSGQTYWLSVGVVLGFSQGFGTLIAQRFGAGDESGLHRAAAMSALCALVLGGLFSVMGVVLTRGMLSLLNTPKELIDGAAVYLQTLTGGLLITFAYNLLASMLRALGNGAAPLIALLIASVLNILLDVALVALTPMGIGGAALATLIAQAVACGYCLFALRRTGNMRLTRRDFAWNADSIRQLLRLGAPAGFRNVVITLGGLLIQYFVNGYGALFVTGVAAPLKLYGFIEIIGAALDGAIAVFVAQNFGARNLNRVREGVVLARRMMLFASAAIILALLALGRPLMGLLIPADTPGIGEVMRIAQDKLLAMFLGLPFLYLLFLYRSALSGMGNALFPMLSGFAEMALRVLSVLILPPLIGVWGIYLSQSLGWVAAFVLLAVSHFWVYRNERTRAEAKEPIPLTEG